MFSSALHRSLDQASPFGISEIPHLHILDLLVCGGPQVYLCHPLVKAAVRTVPDIYSVPSGRDLELRQVSQ